jgi:hypothetical protein
MRKSSGINQGPALPNAPGATFATETTFAVAQSPWIQNTFLETLVSLSMR